MEMFQVAYTIMLDENVKDFFRENNGGIPNKNGFKLKNGDEKVLDCLLSFNRDDDESVYHYADFFKSMARLEILPFAKDPFGNLICLKKNRVVFWDQELEELLEVSDSFEGLIDGLY